MNGSDHYRAAEELLLNHGDNPTAVARAAVHVDLARTAIAVTAAGNASALSETQARELAVRWFGSDAMVRPDSDYETAPPVASRPGPAREVHHITATRTKWGRRLFSGDGRWTLTIDETGERFTHDDIARAAATLRATLLDRRTTGVGRITVKVRKAADMDEARPALIADAWDWKGDTAR